MVSKGSRELGGDSTTNTESLNVANEAAKSQFLALGYAGTYAFANVLLTFVGAWLMTL